MLTQHQGCASETIICIFINDSEFCIIIFYLGMNIYLINVEVNILTLERDEKLYSSKNEDVFLALS